MCNKLFPGMLPETVFCTLGGDIGRGDWTNVAE